MSFVVPTLNAASLLERSLGSIRRQDYPQDRAEIIIADGGSQDATRDVARAFQVRIVENVNRLAEFGVKEGMLVAKGDYAVIFAADNELPDVGWLRRVVSRFEQDPDLAAVFGRLVSGDEDPPLNKYIELIQSDPLNWFLNRNLERYLRNREPDRDGAFSFNVDPRHPIVWGANGLVVRTAWARPYWNRPGYVADVDAFNRLIQSGHRRVVYFADRFCYHHQVGKLADLREKWLRNLREHLFGQSSQRDLSWVLVPGFRFRLVLWMFYSLVPPVSLVDALHRMMRDRSRYWLYHPVAAFLQTVTYSEAFLRDARGRQFVGSALMSRRK